MSFKLNPLFAFPNPKDLGLTLSDKQSVHRNSAKETQLNNDDLIADDRALRDAMAEHIANLA